MLEITRVRGLSRGRGVREARGIVGVFEFRGMFVFGELGSLRVAMGLGLCCVMSGFGG